MRGFPSSSDQDSDVPDTMHPMISEEIQDLLMSSDGEVPGSYYPPPHIAARIYRSTANRRKSSATSSRRNSMTSHHSNRSARSGHGRPQSTHIAQHLRRASIIESRKAKAADRNAHAEQVRLRAAMNKAAPRATTNSEERAIAAQHARERFLAQVKANCAEEVKRSKRVAEEQREKRAAEHLKMKEDLEERQAEAERRKILFQQSQRRSRTATLPNVEDVAEEKKSIPYVWKPNSKEKAAKIIQREWRNRKWYSGAREFMQLGLTVDAVQKTTFEEVGELLSQDKVLSSTAKMLRLFGLYDENDDSVQEKAAVRTFLSTFLILGHPAHVLSKEGEQEKDLITKAEDFLSHFNRVIDLGSESRSSASTLPLGELSEVYASFQTAFAAWRAHDSSFMISSMLAQFVELDAIWQTVKDDRDGEVAADYKEGIQQNQTLVLVRLKKLAGPEQAIKMITDAVRASRKARSKKKHSSPDSRPRVASNVPTPSTLTTTEPVPSRVDASTRPLNSKSSAKEQLRASSLVPPNRVVTHEIAINKEWKIDAEPRMAMREDIVRAISGSLQRGLDAGLEGIWIPAMAETIQDKLLGLLVPENSSMHRLIAEVLDPNLVAIQVKNGTFSYQKFFSFMNTILPQLCAPVRDPEVKEITTNPREDPVEQLARLYYIIDLIRLDMLNFTLLRLAPTLLKEAPGYESRYFANSLDGRFPAKLLQWWRTTSAKTQEEASKRSSESPSVPVNRVPAYKTYMQGLTDLAIATTSLENGDLPETLELDHERLNRIRSDILRLITIASMLLTAKNLLRRDVRSLWKAEAQRMWDLPFASTPTAFVAIVESRYALPPTTKQQLTGTITRLLADARDCQVSHPVVKVLLKKIRAHVLTRLSASSTEDRIRASTTSTEVLGSSGMPEFVGRVGDIVQELGRVAIVDREAHGEWYDQAAQKVVAGDTE